MSGVPAPTPLPAVWRDARALRDRGDAAGARTLLGHAVQTGGTAYGRDHPDVLETARMLAALYREADELPSARRTLEEALVAGQRSLPADHPLILLLTHDLGFVADALGNRHEARRNLRLVASLGPAALGADHSAVLAATGYLESDASDVASDTPPPPTAPFAPPPAVPVAPAPATPFVPAPPQVPHAPAPATPPAAVGLTPPGPARGRAPVFVAVVVAAIAGAVVAALVATAAVRQERGQTRPGRPSADPPAATAPAEPPQPGPLEVRLRDEGASVTLTWRDPTAGSVPFIVAGALAGEQSRPFANLPAGRTTYTINGLNPRLEYCFTVVAVYSTDSFAASDLVCTRRGGPGPTRTTSR